VLVSAELEVLGQRDVTTSMSEEANAYAAFLRAALERLRPATGGR
jgi:hypothetical protein